mmetsp:Transcript_34992/g.105675  ORF Transcript_34992/g.105675 Transcript_34992/m.105675 type:complete len:99 (+) Transcript_34992:18-314(+)
MATPRCLEIAACVLGVGAGLLNLGGAVAGALLSLFLFPFVACRRHGLVVLQASAHDRSAGRPCLDWAGQTHRIARPIRVRSAMQASHWPALRLKLLDL